MKVWVIAQNPFRGSYTASIYRWNYDVSCELKRLVPIVTDTFFGGGKPLLIAEVQTMVSMRLE
jgi:hypothetical protein